MNKLILVEENNLFAFDIKNTLFEDTKRNKDLIPLLRETTARLLSFQTQRTVTAQHIAHLKTRDYCFLLSFELAIKVTDVLIEVWLEYITQLDFVYRCPHCMEELTLFDIIEERRRRDWYLKARRMFPFVTKETTKKNGKLLRYIADFVDFLSKYPEVVKKNRCMIECPVSEYSLHMFLLDSSTIPLDFDLEKGPDSVRGIKKDNNDKEDVEI